MASIVITLKKVNNHEWQMFAPKGHTIGPKYRGDKYNALEWARRYTSTWHNWVIKLQGE